MLNPPITAYLRPDGRKGIRNVIAVAYLVECAHHVARGIVNRFTDYDQLASGVVGDAAEVHLIGFPGCYPNAYAFKMMQALTTHPNVGGTADLTRLRKL